MVDDRAATPEQWDQGVESERLYDEMMFNATEDIADERAAAAENRRESKE
jgi:hypothetical protein